jgi:hypothetical protein
MEGRGGGEAQGVADPLPTQKVLNLCTNSQLEIDLRTDTCGLTVSLITARKKNRNLRRET